MFTIIWWFFFRGLMIWYLFFTRNQDFQFTMNEPYHYQFILLQGSIHITSNIFTVIYMMIFSGLWWSDIHSPLRIKTLDSPWMNPSLWQCTSPFFPWAIYITPMINLYYSKHIHYHMMIFFRALMIWYSLLIGTQDFGFTMNEPYLVAVYITLPMILIIFVAVVLYLCCSKKYRLNWFEQTILENNVEKIEEKEHINPSVPNSSRRASSIKYAPLASDSSGVSIPSTCGSIETVSHVSTNTKEGLLLPTPSHQYQRHNRVRAQSMVPAIHTPQEVEESKCRAINMCTQVSL